MADTPSGTQACREQRELFFHLRRGELDESRSAAVRAHLADCDVCRRFDEVEAGFDLVLARSLRREALPAGLAARVRKTLDESQRAVSGRPSRPPWVQGLAAAAILVVGMLIPGAVERLSTGPLPAETASLAEVEWTGTLVDDGCDRHGVALDLQKDCPRDDHHTVFKSQRGEYISLVPGEAAALPVGRNDRGTEVRLRGRYNPQAGTLALIALEKL